MTNEYEDEEVELEEEDYDSEEEMPDDTDETQISEEIQSLSRTAMNDLIFKDLTCQNRGPNFKIEKTRLRDVLFYFQNKLKEAGSRVGLTIQMEHLLQWGTHFDNMKLGEEGMRQYFGYIDGCIRFFLLMGYYDSVLMLLPIAAENTPSCNVDHLIHFCNFKYTKPGQEVKSTFGGGGATLKSTSKQKITGAGHWNKLGNIGRFAAALSAVHTNRGQAGGYIESCQNCQKKFRAWNFKTANVPDGCVHHSKQPRFFTTGNPCSKNIKWRNFRKLVTEKTKDLPVSQSSMLQPEELLLVIKHCLQKSTLWYLELAVIILMSCTAFIRNKEMKMIQVEHLRMDLSAVSALGVLEGILLHLHNGKTDIDPALMMLWKDHNIPWFDITWMLLLYLKLTGLRKGFLFPRKQRLNEGNLDKGVEESDAITYDSFCRSFSRACKESLGENRRFTGHTPRPSAFCLSSFRGADAADLKHDSRSKSLDNVCRYKRGAGALQALMETQNNTVAKMLKGTYKHHRFESIDMLAATLQKRFNYLTIDSVVEAFFKTIPEFHSIAGYVEFFTGTTKDTLANIYSDLRSMTKDLQPDVHNPEEVLSSLSHIATRLQGFVILNPRMLETEDDNDDAETADEETKTQGPPPKRPRKAEIPTRKEFSEAIKRRRASRDKLEFLVQYSQNDEYIKKLLSGEISTSSLTKAHKAWFHQSVQGTLHCLNEHHNGDIDHFMQHHKDFLPSRHCKTCSKKKPCIENDCS